MFASLFCLSVAVAAPAANTDTEPAAVQLRARPLVWTQGYASSRSTHSEGTIRVAADLGLRVGFGRAEWTDEGAILAGFSESLTTLSSGFAYGAFLKRESENLAGDGPATTVGVSVTRIRAMGLGRPLATHLDAGLRRADGHPRGKATGFSRGVVGLASQVSLFDDFWVGPTVEFQAGGAAEFEQGVGLQLSTVL